MSEELIPPFTGPMSKETAQFRAQQAVEYYQKHVKAHNVGSQNVQKYDNMNGYGRPAKVQNTDGRHSAQTMGQGDVPESRFVRGGQRATVHGVHSAGRQWQQQRSNLSNRPGAPQEQQQTTSNKRNSRGLYRSNSNLEESMEYTEVEKLADVSMSSKREYGSTSSLDKMNASAGSDSFFAMLQNLKPENTDQRSPAPAKLKEVLRGSKNPNLLRDLERIANGSVINNRPLSDETDDVTQSPRTKTKFKQKERKLRSKSITPETGPGVWKRIRGKNETELVSKVPESVPDVELKGDDRFRRKSFVHYDSQSIGFDLTDVLKHKPLSNVLSNMSTGASAASLASRSSYAGEADDPDIVANLDEGDGRNNDLVHSCSFFRNEIGGEEERVVGLTKSTAHDTKRSQTRINGQTKSAITFNRSPHCCGVTLLDLSPTPVGHILPPHVVHKGHVIEYADTGAYYYRHFFNGQEHQNYFGVDDNLGPVAVSIKREKLEERENYLGKSEAGLYQFRVILRTRELPTLRGSVLEDAIPATGRLSSSRGLPVKDLLEFVTPDLQTSCLRQAMAGQKTCDQLMKLDEQRVFSTYKIGILYCKAGQATEEDMYNNETSSPAFDEFLNLIGERVRLKGFENYRAQLDNKTDSTGTHSVYTTFNNSEIMFHVSTMLPYTPKNPQQLLRKRHIGNDIVTIIFQEPGALPFTAKSVRSQFQHVFIIVRAHHPCTEKTSYSIAISRSKDVPPFGPPIPENARFPKSEEFAQFLLAKVINAENAAHHSEKFYAMASRTRQEYLKDLATNYVTSNSLESASKLSKFALSGKKKEKNKGKLVPDNFALGAIVWRVQVEEVGQSAPIECFLGIAAETLVLVEESSKDVIFTTHCGAVIGWTSQALSLKLYYNQGECLVLRPTSGEMEELQEVLTRLSAVTPGCETVELTLKRNGLGQLGFHIQTEGIVTEVEQYGFAYEAGLRKGSRLVEICKVATITLSHEQMVDLLRTSATVKVVVIPPLKDGGPRSVVNLQANHHYSSFAALNAVIQAEFSLHQRPDRSSSSSVDLGPTTEVKDQYPWQPRPSSLTSDISPRVEMRDHHGRQPRTSSSSSEQAYGSESRDIAHERDSSLASSAYSPRSSNTLPPQKKVLTHSDPRGEMKSPPARAYYITDKQWQSSSLSRSAMAGYHGYQDSLVSSGRGSLFEGRETGDHYDEQFGSRRGLDDSTYGTLEDRHTRSGSRDSADTDHYGSGRDWSEKRTHRSQHTQESHWSETRESSSYVASSENLYSSSSSRKQAPANTDYSGIQHGNYAQELLKQSQNTKYLLSHESSRGINSTNSSSANLSDTSFSSSGSFHTASLSNPGAHVEDQSTQANLVNRDETPVRRRANTTSSPQSSKSRPSALDNKSHLSAAISPLSSEDSSPRSSHKNLSGMSSEESLSTRLRPGVTTRMSKSKASSNLQDDLMRLIDPDIEESDLASILANNSSNRRLSGRLVRTMSDESLHSGKAGGLIAPDVREALFAERSRQDRYNNKNQQKHLKQARLSPRATSDTPPRPSSGARVPVPDSTASLDWSSLVDVATKAIEGSDQNPSDRISSPANAPLASSTLTRDVKIDSLYRTRDPNRPPDPPTASNPPMWRSVVANPQQRIHELEEKVRQLEEELAQERQESAALDAEVQRLRNENDRLQEESQNAAAQLRRFTEWFFTTIDRQ